MENPEFSGNPQFAIALNNLLVLAGMSMNELARRTSVHPRTVHAWMREGRLPSPANFEMIAGALDGMAKAFKIDLRKAYDQASGIEHHDVPVPPLGQVSAAFKFGVRDAVFDTLPEDMEVIDVATAQDLYGELTHKLADLEDRLKVSNSDPHVRSTVQRLRQSLGSSFDQVRAGVLLSRMRTMGSVVKSYDSEDGRAVLFPDALAMMHDVEVSGNDLLLLIPNIRRIEQQRVALQIVRQPDAIQPAVENFRLFMQAVVDSKLVSHQAIEALQENDEALSTSQDNQLRADLTADKLLVIRNFASAAIHYVLQSGRDVWDLVEDDIKTGTRHAARILPAAAVVALLTHLAGPIAGLAALANPKVFNPIRDGIEAIATRRTDRMKARGKKATAADQRQGSSE